MPAKIDKLVSYLEENGPTNTRSLRHITTTPPRRFHGVKELRINPGRSTGSTKSSSGTIQHIVYLEDEHNKREVLEVWANYHSDMIDRVPADAIYRETPAEFREEIKQIIDIDAHYSNRGRQEGDKKTSNCPLCGDDLEGKKLPTHLEKECDA